MTRLIKLTMVASLLVCVSAVHAQLFNEDYTGTSTNGPAYNPTNGVEWVEGTGLVISNTCVEFDYTGTASVTNALVEFSIQPVLNDAVPTDVAGSSVVFWVNTLSNVCWLLSDDSVESNGTYNVIQADGSVDFSVTNNYVAKTFTLVANGDLIVPGEDFYSTDQDELTTLKICQSTEEPAVVETFTVYELEPDGTPTAVTDADLKVYERDGTVYVELNIEADSDGSFELRRDGVLVATVDYVEGQSVYVIEDDGAVLGGTYTYSVADILPNGELDDQGNQFDVEDVTVLPLLEAKSIEMTQTHMSITFASAPGETYKVVGLTALGVGEEPNLVEDNISADSYETTIQVEIGDNYYFKVIKK